MDDLHPFPFVPDTIGAIDDPYDDDVHFSAGLCEFEALAGGNDCLYPDGFRTFGRCARGGCTPRRACRDGGRGCHWVNDRATLCSRCEEFPERRRYRRRRPLLAFHTPTARFFRVRGGVPWI
jgi:hypothetical protein